MRVLITGGGGFLGKSLASRLLAKPRLKGPDGAAEDIDELVLFDQALPDHVPDGAVAIIGDIRDPAMLRQLFAQDFDSIFHLAAVVSSAAQADFDLGLGVNFDGTRRLLEAMRAQTHPPRMVFASSVAVFGGDLPAVIRDDTPATPQSSYGTQKAMCELLLNDATHKGFIDARCLRLPTIVVRPGRPNRAASSFASSIIREPLAGLPAVCPVPAETEVWLLSPRQVVESFVQAHELASEVWGVNRTLNLPGITVTVGDMVAGLGRAGGDTGLVCWQRDEEIASLVATWPGRMNPERALALGFEADDSIDTVISAYRQS